jgi:hypothetical protein
MVNGGYISQSVFNSDAITLHPNGVYFAFMFVPDPGIIGSSRDFVSGPVIPNSLFPLLSNVDVWLDGVLVDRTPGADAIIPVQPRDLPFQGTSHHQSLQAIWHPWDDDLTVGPLGNYDLRISLRDVGGSGWDVVAPFRVVPEGDANGDLLVNRTDAAILATNFGRTDALWSHGDFDGNGRVDLRDWATLQSNLGHGPSSTAAAVPEPSAGAILLLGLFAASLFRNNRLRRRIK